MLLFIFLSFILALTRVSFASAIRREAELLPVSTEDHILEPRQAASATSGTPDAACTNSPSTRLCWNGRYNIATNYDADWPVTGNVVRYTLDVQNTTMAPDGFSRPVYAINGQLPGPTIRANWGDTLQITVKNSLTTNGTSMHWHGIRQWRSNSMDGTNGITECPLAPGQQRTYTFLCTQFGTTWYHSHYSDQYSDGVVGSIIIDGPASSNYDTDLGAFPITDWYHTPAFTLEPLIRTAAIRGPPPGDNILINGTNVWKPAANNTNTSGKYSRTSLKQGKKYRLRLINTSTNDNFKVGLDGHAFTVISADFVPIKPWTTTWLFLGIGERYDVIIAANQPIANYWFHVVPQQGCSSNRLTNAVAVFSYEGANSTGLPPDSSRNNAPPGAQNDCSDPPNSSLVPIVKLNVPQNGTIPQSSVLDVGFAITANSNNQTVVQWNLNFTAIQAPWDRPTLQYVLDNNFNFPQSMNLISLPKANTWSTWVIQAVRTVAPPIAHPIHLHGHDFYVLGEGIGTFNNSQTLQYNNPPRRDVAMLPPDGYLVLAFITDNPGAWLMHCHIAWHIGLGLGAQFLEQPDKIQAMGVDGDWKNQCATWNAYYKTAPYKEEDSGL